MPDGRTKRPGSRLGRPRRFDRSHTESGWSYTERRKHVRVVNKAEGAPTLASATNISAFNVGVMAGAALGGAAIGAGLGFTSVTWVGASIAGLGLLLALLSSAIDRRQAQAPVPLTMGSP